MAKKKAATSKKPARRKAEPPPKYYPLREIALDVEVSRFIALSDVREEVEIIEIREFIEGAPAANTRTFRPGLTRFQTTNGFPVNLIAAERGEFELVISSEKRVPVKLLRFVNVPVRPRR